MTFPGHPFALSSGIAVLLAGFSTSAAFATDRYWDPLNNNSYLSTDYTTHALATVVWNNTALGFDTNPANPTNAIWVAGDDAFINLTPAGTALDAPATNWYMRIGTAAPTVHNVTYDSATTGNLTFLSNNGTAGTAANMAITGGGNGASTWTVGAGDILRLTSSGEVAGATNVGAVNLVNATGVTSVDLVKEGAGRLHIQSTGSTFTGAVRINAGSIQINGNGSLGNTLNDVYIANGATLTANNNSTIAATRAVFLGGATGTGAANLEAQGASFTLTVDSVVANNGADVGNLTKTGAGTVFLTNLNNNYTGVTTAASGTLRVANLTDGGVVSAMGASSSAASNLVLNNGTLSFTGASANSTNRLFTIAGNSNISNNSAISTSTLAWTNVGTVANTATGAHSFTLGGSNTGANTFAPSLADNGANVLSLIKGGASDWTLSGTHTYTGTTTIGNGTAGGGLEFNGNLIGAGGIVDVTTGNRLSGTGGILRNVSVTGTLAPGSTTSPLGTLNTVGAVTFNAGGSLAVNLSGTTASKVSGVTDLTLNDNTVTVTLNAANLPAGTGYDIVDFTGVLAGTFNPTVAVAGLTGLTSRIAFGLDYSVANKVRLTQTGQAKSLTWTGSDGTNPTAWNVNGATNWTAGVAEKFFDLDTVTFGDSAANRTVDIATNVTPSAIVMNNTGANDYFISATTGAIIGPASFTKSGSAKLTISGAHSFTGPFTIDGGTVITGVVNDSTVAGPLGQGTIVLGGGGTLDYTGGTATSNRPMQFAAGGGIVRIPDAVDLTFSGPILGAGGVTKTGGGILRLTGTNGFDGPVLVSAGVLKLGNSNSLGTAVGGTTVSAGATLDLAATATTMALPQDEVITVSGTGVDLDADTIPDGVLVNFGTAAVQNALKKVVLAGDATFGGPQRFDVRIAGTSEAGFVAGTHAYLKGNGFNLTKIGLALNTFAGVGDTDLANIDIKGGTLVFQDAANSDPAMMLASDATLGRVSDGAGNFYKVTLEAGTTLQFFNSDGVRSKDIVANGLGTDVTITMNSNVGVAHTLTLDRGITVNGGLTLNSASATDTTLRISGVISEGGFPAAVTKTGGGAVVLTSANTYTGGTTISNGRVRIGNNAALGTGGLNLAGGSISSIGNVARQIDNPLRVTGNATLGDAVDNGPLTFSLLVDLGNGARNLSIASDVTFATGMNATAPGGLNQKLGNGTLTIGSGSSTSSGVLEVRGGAVVLESGTALATGDAVRVMAATAGGNATFTMHPGSSLVIGTGTANIRIGHESVTITDGTNIANIAGDLAFSAPSTGGNIQLGSDSALAQLNLLAGGTITARGIGVGVQTPVGAVTEFNFDGGKLRTFLDNGAFIPAVLTSAKVKAGGGTIDTNGFAIGIAQPLVHDPALGALRDGGITKVGLGTLTLDGVNTYTGATIVNEGALVVSASGSVLDSIITQVNVSATLSGSGSVGALKLNGGSLLPGTGAGVLTAANSVDFAGGFVSLDINGLIPGTDYDQFSAAAAVGSVIKISAPTELSLTLGLGFTPTLGDSFVLIDNDSSFAIDRTSLFTVGATPVPNGGQFDISGTTFALHYDGGDGNDLEIVVVPEPTGAALLLGGLGILSRIRRRRS